MWKNTNKMKVMDPSTQMIDYSVFNYNANCVEFYKDVVEEDPSRMPEPLGEPMSTSTFVDYDHASNITTRISHTGIILFV